MLLCQKSGKIAWMRVCFDGLCFASKRPAVDEETQTVLCGGATALDVRPINHSTGAPNDTVVSYASSISRNNHIHTVPPHVSHNSPDKLKLRMQEPNSTVPSTDYGNNNSAHAVPASNPTTDQPPFYINNCFLASEPNLLKAPPGTLIADHISALYINEEHNMNLGPKERELLQAVVERETRVRELEECLRRKDEEIAELKSQLDKFQSVFPFSRSRKQGAHNNGAVQRQRAQGISAEPQSESSVLELLKVTFPKYDKEER